MNFIPRSLGKLMACKYRLLITKSA